MHHETTRALLTFRKRSGDVKRSARYLRTRAEITDQIEALSALDLQAKEATEFLTGICFAKNWSEVIVPNGAPRIENTQKAINWSVAVLGRHADILGMHAEYRRLVNNAVLEGNWSAARELLARHHGEFGPTLWMLAWLLVIAEEDGGKDAKLEFVDRLTRSEVGPRLPIFVTLLNITCDKGLSEDQCRAAVADIVPQDAAGIKQFIDLFLFDGPNGDWKVWQLLEYIESLPIVDRYELFIRLAITVVSESHGDTAVFTRALRRLAKECSDAYLTYIISLADVESQFLFAPIEKMLNDAWDSYIIGEYRACASVAERVGSIFPEIYQAHELFVKASMYLGESEQISGTTPLRLLRHHLRNIFSKNEQTEDSLNYLRRFATRYHILSLSAPLRALHAQHSVAVPEDRWNKYAAFAHMFHGPRNMEYSFSLSENVNYLGRLHNAIPNSVAARFFLDVACERDVDLLHPNVPPIRRRFFSGITAAKTENMEVAVYNLSVFLNLQTGQSINALSPFAVEEARRALVDLYWRNESVAEMQRQIVLAYLERAHSVRRLPIQKAFRLSMYHRDIAARHIEFPVLAYFACDEPHDVSLALKRFLKCHACDRPSDLKVLGLANDALAILYLRICTPEVLDSLRALDTVHKVESERLSLLEWIINNNTSFCRLAETEVLRLTQQAELRDTLHKLDGARVVLNVSGLREAEQQRFSEAYFRYIAQRDLAKQIKSENLTSWTFFGGRDGPIMRRPTASPKVLASSEAEFLAFASAFREIRDAFVSSPHFGIEACLSGRIRHGFLVEHLRKPMVERKLALKTDSPEKEDIVEFWRNRLYLAQNSVELLQVTEALLKLTDSIDSITEEVKNHWIQSHTESRNQFGLFDYEFTDEQLRGIYNKMQDAATVELFLDGVFELLLDRTRTSLRSVQESVKTVLVSRMRELIDNAIAKLPSVNEMMRFLPLRNDLASFRSESERACQQLAQWFATSDAALMGDAEFNLVARTAVGMIERLNPFFLGKQDIQIVSTFRLRGRHFTSLVHIVFFLLDNAIRHSHVAHDRFRSKLTITAESNVLIVNVSNQTHSVVGARESALKINEIISDLRHALDPAKVIREGGSGFAKVIAAIRYEFKQRDPSVEAMADGCVLSVTVKCELAGLAK